MSSSTMTAVPNTSADAVQEPTPAAQEAPQPAAAAAPQQQDAPQPSSANAGPPTLPLTALPGELKRQLYELQQPALNRVFDAAEQKGVKREQLALGVVGLAALYLLLGPGAGLLVNLVAVLYAGFKSLQAARDGNKDEATHWTAFWILFGTISLLDFAAESLIAYWLLKAVALLYIAHPLTRGASVVHAKALAPALARLDKKSE